MAAQEGRATSLYRLYGAAIYARCRRLLGDNAAAEDATQETFLRVCKHLEKAQDDEGAKIWVFRIATNYCLDLLRHRTLTLPADVPVPERNIEQLLADRDLAERIIAHAPSKIRPAAFLHYVDGLDQGEVARMLGISRRTVGSQIADFLRRARARDEGLQMSDHLTLLELDAVATAKTAPSAHLATCTRCQTELDTMRASHDRFRREVFPRSAEQIERRYARRWWRWAAPLVLAPVLGALVVMVRPRGAVEPDYSTKGSPTLHLVIERANGAAEVREGAHLRKGDALRFEVQPGGFTYLLIGSVASEGEPDIIFPMDGAESGKIDPSVQFILPGSAVLDASPGPERAFVLLSRQPISATAATTAMRELAKGGANALRDARSLPNLPAETQLSIFWEKDQ